MDDIRRVLSSVLSESDVPKVIDQLAVLGAESIEDLKFLDADTELASVLPLLKRRRLAAHLKAEFGSTSESGNNWNENAASASSSVASHDDTATISNNGLSNIQTVTTSNNSSTADNVTMSAGISSKKNVSILDALEKHPEKGCIIEAMNKPVADERLHRVMVKAACSYLLDICGRYPPPEKQLAMAVDIVRTFPQRACKAGKGHEMYYCTGSGKGFLTNRMREIYRRYPVDSKKYQPRKKKQGTESNDVEPSTEDDYNCMKVKLGHTAFSDRTEHEILELTRETLAHRRTWIKQDCPTAAEILRQFPRFTDTPNLVSEEFSWCHAEARQNSSVYLETILAPQVIKYCRQNNLCGDALMAIGDNDREPDKMVLTAVKCLLTLLPTTGKNRVSSSAAVRYVLDDCSDCASSLEEAVRLQRDENTKLLRTQPYILKLGQNYFVMIDGSAIIIKPYSLALAVDVLLKSFYVFNIMYPKQTVVFHKFMVHMVLDLQSNLTPKSIKLVNELFRQDQ